MKHEYFRNMLLIIAVFFISTANTKQISTPTTPEICLDLEKELKRTGEEMENLLKDHLKDYPDFLASVLDIINVASGEEKEKGCLLTEEDANNFSLQLTLSLGKLNAMTEVLRIALLSSDSVDDFKRKLTFLEQELTKFANKRKPLISEYHNRSCCGIVVPTRFTEKMNEKAVAFMECSAVQNKTWNDCYKEIYGDTYKCGYPVVGVSDRFLDNTWFIDADDLTEHFENFRKLREEGCQ